MLRSLILFSLSVMAAISTANAADATAGKAVFTSKCSSCHANGGNMVSSSKTLSADHLKANQIDTEVAISSLVTNGKMPMPAFSSSLTAEEIQNVTAYVLQQAKAGWK